MIVGCGYVGQALGQRLSDNGHRVFGMRRDPSSLPEAFVPLAADISRSDGIGALPGRVDFVVFAAGAKSRDESAYRSLYLDGMGNILRVLKDEGQRPARVVFTSSTSVYGQRRGEWVDEDSPTHPQDFAGEIMLSTERLLLGSSFPSTAIRLGGIYGPDRTSMVKRVLSGAPIPIYPSPQYGNRIHREDAAGAIEYLLGLDEPAPTYVGVDNDPADRADVLRWMASELGRVLPAEQAAMPARGSKRCRNARLRAEGFVLSRPSFREGYADLLPRDSNGAA
ncbi:SDR family oxidoreductase [Myxococcota bacterium]|nr:SDR family oxidoreductase [Myxococcota bacterium]